MPWLAPRYGGPVMFVPELSHALAERGHHVEIVTTNADGRNVLDVPTGRTVDWAGASAVFHGLSQPRRYVTSWSMLADLLNRAPAFDLLHIHYLYRFHGLAAAYVARSRMIPYVVQAHGSLDPWHRRNKGRAKDLYHAVIEDRIFQGAGAMLCTSRREELAVRALGYSVPTFVIPIGIAADELRVPGIPAFDSGSALDVDAQIVTFLGRISAKKGVPLLVDAFRSTAAAFPRAHLVIAGPDEEGIARDLLPLISEAGLVNRISFPGVLGGSRKRSLLQQSACFVLPSADESFGIAVAEAMAVGCPVVVSSEVAIEDVVRASGAGLVVNRDPIPIAAAVAEILNDPARAARMGAAGRRVVDEQFSWPIVAARMETFYVSVLSSRRPMPAGTQTVGSQSLTNKRETEVALRCPQCRGGLERDAVNATWSCAACGWLGREDGGIPILLVHPERATQDELDHDHVDAHKGFQAAHFDRPGEERFETERPHGTPRLYRFFLGYKMRRAVGPIRPHLLGASTLIVCGGSGMDAEYLARVGATVTTSDLSLGAATRARARSERYQFSFSSIVADVERLPFTDHSVDLVAVHDGLHHLADPFAGLSEMTRVARRWVVVSEPARASVTRLAIRLGLALETEAAGNRVARLEPDEVAKFLRDRGFVVLSAKRYAMYYPHHPGTAFRLLSRPGIFPIVRVGWSIANKLVGRFGNKMVVVAERETT